MGGFIKQNATQSVNDSYRAGPSPTRTTYVFVFVSVYIYKKSDPTVRPTTHGSLVRFQRVFFRQERHFYSRERVGPPAAMKNHTDPT
jgi:hypothetical protein